MNRTSTIKTFVTILFLAVMAAVIALPQSLVVDLSFIQGLGQYKIGSPNFSVTLAGKTITNNFALRTGLDIQGGMRVVLAADMSQINPEDQPTAIEAAREIIARRVDLYGIAEPTVKTAKVGEEWRIIVELPGLQNQEEALALIGQTAQLDFQLLNQELTITPDATAAAAPIAFVPTGLSGTQLEKAQVQFDPQTNKPVVSLSFDEEGRDIFAQVTKEHTGDVLAIILDGQLLMMPRISVPILNGQAVIEGEFSVEDAKQLSIQLNSGALPVPISVLEQQSIGASLGQEAVYKSVVAGLIGLVAVLFFMIVIYGWAGFLSALALILYGIFTVALYKIIGVTVTLPGLAGLLLSIGMAVDANILIFERMKEERRAGKSFSQAMELGFGRAWDSIKDANIATILTALVLINPLDFSFLSSGGLVRGFGITLLIGVILGLFTGVVVSRTFLRLFLNESNNQT